MQKWLLCFIFIGSCSFSVFSQIAPQPSPGSTLTQTIGITEARVEYSRPGVKGRTIFGGLLPYGKVWRTGANAATKIKFSTDVLIEGHPVPQGMYTIVTFPETKAWTVVFSSDMNVTEETYSPHYDVLRINIKPVKREFTETFTIDFSNIHDDRAQLNIYWETTGISLGVAVNNEKTILMAIEAKNNETAGAFQQAAEYLLNRNMNEAKAMEYIDKSISLKETFRNTWIKAVLLRKAGKYTEALQLAQKANDMGASDPVYPLFREAIKKAILELKTSVPAGK